MFIYIYFPTNFQEYTTTTRLKKSIDTVRMYIKSQSICESSGCFCNHNDHNVISGIFHLKAHFKHNIGLLCILP